MLAANRRQLEPILVTTPARWGMVAEEAGQVEVRLAEDFSPASLHELVESVRPLACICGTTRFSSPDRRLTQIGKAVGVRTVAVLDEWFNYRYRFADPDSQELAYLPDVVAVQDEQARREAVAEGIPESLCHITGSPALAALTLRARQMAAAPPEIPAVLRGLEERPVVTFLSETHLGDYGGEPGSSGSMGPFIGYTEVTVRQAILETLIRIGQTVLLVEKLHPASEGQEAAVANHGPVQVISTKRANLWPLLWHSDAVVGMRSMALLEACILGAEAVSMQPGLIGPERCTAVRLGLMPRLEHPGDLEAWLTPRLGKTNQQRKVRQFPFATPEAAERILALALSG